MTNAINTRLARIETAFRTSLQQRRVQFVLATWVLLILPLLGLFALGADWLQLHCNIAPDNDLLMAMRGLELVDNDYRAKLGMWFLPAQMFVLQLDTAFVLAALIIIDQHFTQRSERRLARAC